MNAAPGEAGAPVPGAPTGAPTERAGDDAVPTRWIVAYVLATAGVAAGWFGPIQILLPTQAARLAPEGGKESLLAWALGWGAFAPIVAGPLWAAAADRLPAPCGPRRVVLLAGTVMGTAGLLVLSATGTRTGLLTGWLLVQVGLNGPFAVLAALLGDRVPEGRRGTVSALFGVAQTVGVVLGTGIALAGGAGPAGYLALAVAVPLLVCSLLPVHRGWAPAASPAEAAEAAGVPAATGPRAAPSARCPWPARAGGEFAWAWTLRFLLNLVNALVMLYLFYYLADTVRVSRPADLVFAVTVEALLVGAGTAGAAGLLSDRYGRRKVFIVAAALVLAAGAALLAALPTVPAVVAAAALIGCGWGLYTAVDLAVLTQVLPDPRTRATLLGVANVASTLPQVVTPAMAALIINRLGGYPVLYGVAGAVSLLALACTSRLRSVA